MSKDATKLPFNPFSSSAVANPWTAQEPDVVGVNESAYKGLIELANGIRKMSGVAAVVLGEAGSGKTHLVKRLVSQKDMDLIFIYVYPMKNPRVMLSTLLNRVVADLEKQPLGSPPDSKWTQFDFIVANVIAKAFEHYLNERPDDGGQVFLNSIKKDPLKIYSFQAGKKWENLLERTRKFLKRSVKLTGDESGIVLKALFQYIDKSKREAVLTFLSGNMPDQEDAEALGIHVNSEDFSSEAKQERSKKIFIALGKLLTFYRPMIICFDQLEALDTPNLVKAFGDLINDIVNEVENVLPVCFARIDSLEGWTKNNMDAAAYGRIAQNKFELDQCDVDQALEIVKARLAWAYEGALQPPPHEFHPLDPEQLKDEIKRSGKTPRTIISTANRLLGEQVVVEDPLNVIKEAFDTEREKQLAGGIELPIMEQDSIAAALRLYFENRTSDERYKVDKVVVGDSLDLAIQVRPKQELRSIRTVDIMIQTASHWRPLTSSFDLLRDRLINGDAVYSFVIRDERQRIPPKEGGMPKTVNHMKAYQEADGEVVYVDQEDLADLYSLVHIWDAVAASDITYVSDSSGAYIPVGKEVFLKFLRDFFHSKTLTAIEKKFLGEKESNKPPQHEWPHPGRKKTFNAVVNVLGKPPFKFKLENIVSGLKQHRIEWTEEKLIKLIGEHSSDINQIGVNPPIYHLKNK